jgi:hypothetical protein
MKKLLVLGMVFILACKPTPSNNGGTGGGGSGGSGEQPCDPTTAITPCPKMSVGTDTLTIRIDTTATDTLKQ